MNKHKSIIIIILITTSLLAACGGGGDATNIPGEMIPQSSMSTGPCANELYPVKVGDIWNYQVYA